MKLLRSRKRKSAVLSSNDFSSVITHLRIDVVIFFPNCITSIPGHVTTAEVRNTYDDHIEHPRSFGNDRRTSELNALWVRVRIVSKFVITATLVINTNDKTKRLGIVVSTPFGKIAGDFNIAIEQRLSRVIKDPNHLWVYLNSIPVIAL